MKARDILAVFLALPALASCVSKTEFDRAVVDATSLRANLQNEQVESSKRDAAAAERAKATDAALASLTRRLATADADLQTCDNKLVDLTTSSHNVQAQLDDATAINQKLSTELGRLGQDVNKILAEKGTLAKSLDDAKARLDELRKAQVAAEARAALYQDLVRKFRSMIDAGQLKIVVRHGRLVLQLSTDVLFDSGGVDVKPVGKAALAEVARALKQVPGRQFQVAGHTDNVPISSRFPSNWELSSERAIHVLKLLLTEGVAAPALSAAGYGEFDPVGPNDSAEGRSKNRRIEITLQPNIDELVSTPASQ